MDVQGFECFVLAGMGQLLRNARKIFFEVEEQVLGRFKEDENGGAQCSGALLLRQIQRAGFVVQGVDDLTGRTDAELRRVGFGTQDMYGERPG
jgi:hypothetical protein